MDFEYRSPVSEKVKMLARREVKKGLKEGRIKKPVLCQSCLRKKALFAHHESYLKEDWLKVRWLCSSCHRKADMERRVRERKECLI